MTDHDTYPAALQLPAGVAQLVPGMAVYLLNGVPIDVDVEIPDDLAAAGWTWWGTFLHQQLRPDGCGISIDTGTYPPPGVPGSRGTCFGAARNIEATHARMEAERQAATLKKPKKKRARPAADLSLSLETTAPEQRGLWEVV